MPPFPHAPSSCQDDDSASSEKGGAGADTGGSSSRGGGALGGTGLSSDSEEEEVSGLKKMACCCSQALAPITARWLRLGRPCCGAVGWAVFSPSSSHAFSATRPSLSLSVPSILRPSKIKSCFFGTLVYYYCRLPSPPRTRALFAVDCSSSISFM